MAIEKNGLTRRSLLQGMAALMATRDLPVGKILPALETVMSELTPPMLQAMRLIEQPIWWEMLLDTPYNRAEDVAKGTLETLVLWDEETKALSIAHPLPFAWEYNAHEALGLRHLKTVLDKAIHEGADMPISDLVSLLKNPSQVERLTTAFAEKRNLKNLFSGPGFAGLSASQREAGQKTVRKGFIEEPLINFAEWLEDFSISRPGMTMKAISSYLQETILESLKLPVEKGCLDRIGQQEWFSQFKDLLEESPELFPSGNLSRLRTLAADMEKDGPQIPRRTGQKDRDQWQWHVGSQLPYVQQVQHQVQSSATADPLHEISCHQSRILPLAAKPERAVE